MPSINRLKTILTERNITQVEAARLTGLHIITVNLHCRAARVPAESAFRYARALDIDPAELRPDLFAEAPRYGEAGADH